jgi:hypothetical protein
MDGRVWGVAMPIRPSRGGVCQAGWILGDKEAIGSIDAHVGALANYYSASEINISCGKYMSSLFMPVTKLPAPLDHTSSLSPTPPLPHTRMKWGY